MKFSINRLKEPSTWAAVAALCLVFGMNDEDAKTLSSAGAAIASLVAMLMRDR